jgi:hypothetical protein
MPATLTPALSRRAGEGVKGLQLAHRPRSTLEIEIEIGIRIPIAFSFGWD